jgi:hypothetical protein
MKMTDSGTAIHPARGHFHITTIPAHRDNEGMKAGALKTDMAGLSYKSGTRRAETSSPDRKNHPFDDGQ